MCVGGGGGVDTNPRACIDAVYYFNCFSCQPLDQCVGVCVSVFRVIVVTHQLFCLDVTVSACPSDSLS